MSASPHSSASVAFFVVSLIAGPALLIYALLADHEHPGIWQVIAGIAAWLLVTTFLGGAVYLSLGEMRKPGLILYDDRFEYENHTWWWTDIADIRPAAGGSDGNAAHGLRAVYNFDISLPSAPADLPFSVAALDTGGRPLERHHAGTGCSATALSSEMPTDRPGATSGTRSWSLPKAKALS